MKDIKVVLFDHDDTLVDTFGNKAAQHMYVAKKYYGRDLTEEDLKREWGKSLHTVLMNLYDTDDIDRAIELSTQHHKEYPKTLFQDTLKTLTELRERGVLLGTLTSTVHESHDYDMQNLGFPEGIFAYTQTQEDTVMHKPDPRVFDPVKAWLKDQGLRPDQVLYVGDSMYDYKAAQEAGLHFVGVDTGPSKGQYFRDNDIRSIPHVGHLITDVLV